MSKREEVPKDELNVDPERPIVKEDVNIVTKFAFATRVGYIPNNPYKVNQDNYLLNPNILKMPACHYFGVCDGHG
jgi:serine/threonine protein phosphatase PrpC